MVKKKAPLNTIATDSAHVGLLQKSSSAGTSVKWHSPGKESMLRQHNLFGCSNLKVINEEGIINEEVLMDGEDIYVGGVPKGLEGRFYRYRVDTFNQGKKNTYDLTYLEQCLKSDSKEWISTPDDSDDGSGKILSDVAKNLVLAAHLWMRERQAVIREYRKQKGTVMKASLEPTKPEPMHAKDVDCSDIIKAANSDRDAGWASYAVLKVSP